MAQDRDDKQEALDDLMTGDPRRFCAKWLEAIEAAGDEEKAWREVEAEAANKAYKGDASSTSKSFNIFHSNIETLVPALYNTTPIPDVRRRFNDDDPVAAQLSELLERALSFCVDDYDFNDVMRRVVKDMAVVDRGIARVKYEPTFGTEASVPAMQAGGGLDPESPGEDMAEGMEEPASEPVPVVEYEEAKAEYVMWRNFRRGPATSWDRVPWIAFKHGMSRTEVEKLVARAAFSPELKRQILERLVFDVSAEDNGETGKEASRELPTFGKRINVWEIWDKDTKTVIWVSETFTEFPLSIMPDPLNLRGFFPTPRPAMIIEATDSLTPITSYSIYANLIDELNSLTERIAALVKQLRVRGAYAGVIEEIPRVANADDGELIPLGESELFATTGGGLDKAIVWWPIEIIANVIKELVAQRDLVKAVIYEVTGLADIIRGASDPNETATAQQIKQQWGSIRVQAHQKEVERYAADLFRLKAEIFCKHFDIQTLLTITGLQFPTQADKDRAQAMLQKGEQMMQQMQQMQAAIEGGQVPPEQAQAMQQQMQQLQQMMPQIEEAKKQIDDILGKPSLEEIDQLRGNDRVLKYRVDIESDSTVRADLTKNQEQLKGFLEGTAQFAGAIGPLVQQGTMPGEVAIEIFAAFARNFRLGKQAEDALDKWADNIKKGGIPSKEDPTVQAEADLKTAQAEKARAEAGKVQTETELMPMQFQAGLAKDRATLQMQARGQAAQERGADFDRKENAKLNRAKHGLEVGRAKQADRHHAASLEEQRAARQQAPQPAAAPEGDMAGEADAFMQQAPQMLAQLVAGLDAVARTQEASTAQMAAAIAELAQKIDRPKTARAPKGRQ